MKKQSEKTAQTQADLVEAFWKLYKEKPINKITVKEITDTAGYYRSTFYYYFEDVYAILEYIENSVMQEWESCISKAFQDEQICLLQYDMHLLIDYITPFYIQNGEYISVLLSPKGDPLFNQRIKETVHSKLFTVLDIPFNIPEAELFFECIISGMLALFVKWYNDKLPLNLVMNVVHQIIIDRNVLTILLSYSSNPLIQQLAFHHGGDSN